MTYGDRFLTVAAYYLIASRYHSGQWSKGYRKLSQCVIMGFKPGPLFGVYKGSEERNAAACLLWEKRKEIRSTW